MIRVLESSSGVARQQAAEEFVAAFPPSTEVLLIGASRDAVDDLVRRVSRRSGATFGLHRFSFTQWVALLAAGELARRGLAPASPLGQQAVAARAAFEATQQQEIPSFAPITHFPGFARALASTLEELRQADIDDAPLDTAATHAPESADLSVLLRRYREQLETASIADRSDLLRLARAGIAESTLEHLRTAPLVLMDVALTSVLELDLLREFCRDTKDLLVTVPAGDRRTLSSMETLFGSEAITPDRRQTGDSALTRLRGFLFSDDPPPPGSAGEQVRFFSAPGEGRECTEIARLVLEEARRGVAFDRMAVLLRTPEAYQTLLETALRRAEIPAYYARGTRRPDPTGRAFLALLACRSEDLSAKRFAEYLSFGQVPDLDAEGAPPTDREVWVGPEDDSLGRVAQAAQAARAAESPSRSQPLQLALDFEQAPAIEGTLRAPWKWEELLVDAAVIGGHERWRRRIAGLQNELRLKLGELQGDEPGSPRRRAIQRDLDNLGHLSRFANPVVEFLDALPSVATWGDWLERLTCLAPQVLRDPQRVLAVLAELQPMGSVGPVGIDEVRSVLAQRLVSLEAERPVDRYGRLFVATPDQVRGRGFRVVFVPGLAERVFPQRPREDPLLLDALRVRLSDDLETQEDRGQAERLFLRLAAGAAEERIVLSYPRVDVQEARPRVPSFYGLDVARATRGVVPDYEELERDAATEVDARLAWPAPPDPTQAIDAIEHDLAVLGPLLHGETGEDPKGRARYLLELNHHLGRSLRARWARWRQRKWTPRDGLVRVTEHTAPALEKNRPGARPYSATALQKFAACPYRFLLSAIHRLEPRKEAVSIERLDPLTRGALFHEVQAATLRRLLEAGALPLHEAAPESAQGLLDGTLDEIAAAYRDQLAPAIPRVWEDEIEGLRADLRAWLLQMAAEQVWQPAYFEYSFGLSLGEGRDPESRAEPVKLPGGWLMRGAVDLIERDPRNGDLRVTDHKTGADRTHAGIVVGAGEVLQPVLYSLAVEAALGNRVASGRLSFCTAKGAFAEHEVPIDDRARLYGTEVLQIVDRAVAEGNLPPAPRREACTWCDFRPVCGPLEEIRTARKQREPLADLEQLRSLP